MNTKQQLRQLIDARRGVLVPGAFNALSARVVADLGFEAIYVTGAGVTNMWFGLPDQAFMGLTDIADHTARIRDAVIMLLAGKTYNDISSPDGKVLLKAEVAARLNQILGAQRVIRVYFTDFVVE